MTDAVAELKQTLDAMTATERRAALRTLMPTVVGWYQGSLHPDDPEQPPDVALLLWVDELSAGLIGPLCASVQKVRTSATSGRPRLLGKRRQRSGGRARTLP